ncbi:unnamed protein product [Zymoseptoria tritici ST99CH_3D1]|nr:unnamed protein product [Zymoseptoria tritici ST99CH_3D1]
MQYHMTDQAANEQNKQTPNDNAPHEQRHLSNATDGSASAGTQRTSSLERMETNRSMTPTDGSSTGSIKYTRTGRVSKAAKGQRIHHCDECGKTYTRAEHLRRHQQNHKPGAFPCDVEGCGRSFYREDLLTRHKIRHNDPLNPPSRRQSQASQSSNPNMGGPAPSPAQASGPGFVPATMAFDPNLTSSYTSSGPSDGNSQQHSTSPRPPKRLPVPPNELVGGLPVEAGGHSVFERLDSWDGSFRASPLVYDHDYDDHDDYDSPNDTHAPAHATRHVLRQRLTLHSIDSNHHLHRLMPRMLSPPASVSERALRSQAYSASCGRRSLPRVDSRDTPSMDNLSDNLPRTCDADRNSRERKKLFEPECLSKTGLVTLVSEVRRRAHEQSCLIAYWSRIHDIIPVLHMPSFRFHRASPLLRAAIMALGEQAIGASGNRSRADRLHERCLRVLHQRTPQRLHTYRSDDIQAMVLIEFYARLFSD